MTAEHLVRPPAFAPASDPSRLLAAVADALNACERHGLVVDLERDGVITVRGYVLPVGDCRLGSRWAVRSRLEADGELAADSITRTSARTASAASAASPSGVVTGQR